MPASPDLPEFEIRALATRDSLAQLTSLLHRAYAPLAARGLNINAATQDEARTRERTLSGQTFVALRGRELVGSVTVCSPPETQPGTLTDLFPQYLERSCCRFHQFAVDPDYTGRGLASLLLRQAEEWALARGYRAMAVDMAEGATELSAFYRHMGYRVVAFAQIPGKTYRSQVFRKDLHPSPLRAPLLTMARHHRWATDRLLDALATLSDDERDVAPGLGQASVREVLASLLACERGLWWERIAGAVPVPAVPGDAAPGREPLARQLREVAAAWHGLIDAWPEERLHGQLRHRKGVLEREMLSQAEALLQVFGHAGHCRGLLGARLSALGRPVPALDLIDMLKQEAPR
ncbi:MAG: hypothetical protein C0505_12320 [Leptothrix sp. (in: Bacteria)]|nr:hypothetical protein [Leptothrix sp. (in: b-proteobacteria)]